MGLRYSCSLSAHIMRITCTCWRFRFTFAMMQRLRFRNSITIRYVSYLYYGMALANAQRMPSHRQLIRKFDCPWGTAYDTKRLVYYLWHDKCICIICTVPGGRLLSVMSPGGVIRSGVLCPRGDSLQEVFRPLGEVAGCNATN